VPTSGVAWSWSSTRATIRPRSLPGITAPSSSARSRSPSSGPWSPPPPTRRRPRTLGVRPPHPVHRCRMPPVVQAVATEAGRGPRRPSPGLATPRPPRPETSHPQRVAIRRPGSGEVVATVQPPPSQPTPAAHPTRRHALGETLARPRRPARPVRPRALPPTGPDARARWGRGTRPSAVAGRHRLASRKTHARPSRPEREAEAPAPPSRVPARPRTAGVRPRAEPRLRPTRRPGPPPHRAAASPPRHRPVRPALASLSPPRSLRRARDPTPTDRRCCAGSPAASAAGSPSQPPAPDVRPRRPAALGRDRPHPSAVLRFRHPARRSLRRVRQPARSRPPTLGRCHLSVPSAPRRHHPPPALRRNAPLGPGSAPPLPFHPDPPLPPRPARHPHARAVRHRDSRVPPHRLGRVLPGRGRRLVRDRLARYL
jgi:hypothetical protein